MTPTPGRTASLALLAGLLLLATSCSLPRWPTDGPVTSPFGLRTLGSRLDLHSGVDLGVRTGTPVHAMADGTVLLAGARSGYGLAVVLDHGRGWTSMYGHLSRVRVRQGEPVRAGDLLGDSGNTGVSTGPHLHFEVRRYGRAVDPVPLLGGFPP